jgi:hypothetical protein
MRGYTSVILLVLHAVPTHCALARDVATFQLTGIGTARIPLDFIGFSIEVDSAPELLLAGGLGGPPRASIGALLNTLRTAAGAAEGPNIRVGGNSADASVWVPTGPIPPNSTYRITQADLEAYASAIPAWNGSVTVDTTLRYPRQPELDAAHVSASLKALGSRLASFEIGNEPDLFFENGIRAPTYTYAQYKEDYTAVSSVLMPLLNGTHVRVQGATWCSNKWSLADYQDYVTAFGHTFSSISVHRYAETACRGATPTIEGLLADKSAEGLARGVSPYVTAAPKNVPVFIGEGNSISCGGYAGVSDVWASALWVVDALFNMAAVGIKRWAFHGMPNGPYAVISYPNRRVDTPNVRPIFYGLLAFATAAGHSSTLYEVKNVSSTNPYIKCWSVKDDSGATRVVVIHKDPAPGLLNATITIVPAAKLLGTGTLIRGLPGPNGIRSAWNESITFGGLTWSTSTDGQPSGESKRETVEPKEGIFLFEMPPYSIAILHLPTA